MLEFSRTRKGPICYKTERDILEERERKGGRGETGTPGRATCSTVDAKTPRDGALSWRESNTVSRSLSKGGA